MGGCERSHSWCREGERYLCRVHQRCKYIGFISFPISLLRIVLLHSGTCIPIHFLDFAFVSRESPSFFSGAVRVFNSSIPQPKYLTSSPIMNSGAYMPELPALPHMHSVLCIAVSRFNLKCKSSFPHIRLPSKPEIILLYFSKLLPTFCSYA